MRVAILTQPLRTNYGGILQNYALQQCLKEMGHEVCTLDESGTRPLSLGKFVKRAGKILLGRIPASYLFYEKHYRRDYDIFAQATRDFVKAHIDLYPYQKIGKDLAPELFDAYVVGSDQVWRPGYNHIGRMFLDFTEGWEVRRIAYAASFGVDSWEYTPEETKRCAALASRFDAVSVREASGIPLCEHYLGVPATQVLDPTMLLTKEHYTSLIDRVKTVPSEGQLFVHVLDPAPSKQKFIGRLAVEYGVKPFRCNQEEEEGRLEIPIEKRIQPPVEQWLRSFLEAEYVITDSFHATVFAILFNKPFLVWANPGRGATRIRSLLDGFGLEDCLISESSAPSFPGIDYLRANFSLERFRQASKDFLSTHLK